MASIEPSYTKFNLTYPPQPFNNTGTSPSSTTLDVSLPMSIHNPHSNLSQTSTTSNIPSILAGLLIPHVVCTIFILARVWSRLFLLRKWFYDDTLILAAWLFSTAVCTVYSIAAQTPNLDSAVLRSDNSTYTLATYLGLIFYQLTLLLTKLSILSFYLRMFSSRPIERRLAIATIALVLSYGVPLLAISVLQCRPSSFSSHPPPTKCFTFTPLLIASSSLHTATDAWLIVLIAPCIARLTGIPRTQKFALAAVLSLSVFVIAASLTRLQLSLHAAAAGHRPEGGGGGGAGGARVVANTLAFFVMTVLECDVALLCACAPTLRPVLARVWPRGMGEGVVDNGTAAAAAARSKNASAANVAAEMAMPVPPPPAAFPSMLRTPTTLSLRSFMSSRAPRSRGGQTASVREDREVLLGGDEVERKRRSSVGFEGYYDQYMGYEERRKSRGRNDIMVGGGRGAWGDSQESFVLGVNDPASPTRLSPVSALSGTTFAAIADGEVGMGSGDGKERQYGA
ncbi:hypothetical protein CONLIGDRAFT_692046 [Coniochaeta ligniaria NRRL 30616]|uniref:Rhodopsin domain-containing protein n=1 Tax=Coniochaeta ligniaria NRRL 30616 TaxID=1408157 RepID=A0A1J7IAY7_9PEZI|nr:hypothetical protein CONLIGDRAFT_692046 [Coniochaeta ligniaria NRRL 30616]